MPTKEDLKCFQALPLRIKVSMTKTRICEWVRHYGTDGVFISFSGGKDSTVLLHLVRELFPDIEAVFVNTGLEYPEIQTFVKTFDNVTVLYPEMRFDEVIKKYGYPMISKSVSNCVRGAKLGQKSRLNRLNGLSCDGTSTNSKFSQKKYKPLLNVDFNVSEQCCDIMKKNPSYNFTKKTNKKPILATMAQESMLREENWYKNGCNAFESNHPKSTPMSFWTEQDVLQYIKQNDLKIASVYGDIVPIDNQLTLFDDENYKLKTTFCSRTGCIFCGFGCHLEKGKSRFERLKETHPRQYNYCMNGGEYDINGIWKPNSKGLGMAHVIDELNNLYSKNNKKFIKY